LKFHRFWKKSEKSLWSRLKSYAFGLFRKLPQVKRQIQEKMKPEIVSITHSIHECDKEKDFIRLILLAYLLKCSKDYNNTFRTIPPVSLEKDTILERALKYEQMNEKFDYLRGRVSGAVYTDIKENHLEVLTHVSIFSA
jgi:hypothetical protein